MIAKLQDKLKMYYDFISDDCIVKTYKRRCYIVIDAGKRYVLKAMGKNISVQRINDIMRACIRVRECGICTPQFINTKTGEPYFMVGDDIYVIYSWLEGVVLDSIQVSCEIMFEMSSVFSMVVSALSSLPRENRKQGYYWNENMLEQHIEEAIKLNNQIRDPVMKNLLDWKISKMVSLKSKNMSYINRMTWGNSHGDFYLEQVLFDKNGKVIGIIDFDSYSCQPIAYELIRCFYLATDCEFNEQRLEMLANYLKVFMSNNVLTHEDIFHMHDILFIKIITSLYWFVVYKEDPLNYNIKNEAIKISKLALKIEMNEQLLKEKLPKMCL